MSALKIGLGLLINGAIGIFPLLLFTIAVLILCFKKKSDILTYLLEFIIIEGIVSLTLLGIMNGFEITNNFYNISFIPFYSNWDSWKDALSGNIASLIQIVGNIIIFIPVGMIYRHKHGKSLKSAMIVAFLVPCGIELLQLLAGRVADIDDVICNFTGAMIGYYIHAYFSYVYHIPYGGKVEMIKIKGKDISNYFKVGWIVISMALVIRLVTM